MNEQAKILRVFKLISILKKNPQPVSYLAKTFDVSKKTIYRYLDLLEELGFIVDCDSGNRYFIANYDEQKEGIDFTQEEAQLVNDLVETGANKHPLKATILKKLFTHSDIKHISDEIINARTGLLIRKLRLAMDKECRVVLEKYHSANSVKISDRLVEAVGFSNDYESVFAYEVSTKKMKTFKISRIGSVHQLDVLMKFKSEHQHLQVDIFGMSGEPVLPIELDLSFQAYLLLIKEYPTSLNYTELIIPDRKIYRLRCFVSQYEGIARFVLGLIDQVVILGNQEFITFVNEKLEKHRTLRGL